jgi:aminoglycoside N3'-acetyltransferase
MSLRLIIRTIGRRVLRTGNLGELLRKRRLSLKRRFYRTAFSLDQTRELLIKLGVSRGRVLWMQSSWNEFYNLNAKPSEVLALVLDILGPQGTLVMPAFPIHQDPSKVLEIDRAPSSSGLLTEIFRRQPGVLRSIHLSASVCALGPAADYLIRDHHRDPFSWGHLSPYQRLTELDARLVCLGLGRFVSNLTPLHSVECLLYNELPYFQQILQGTVKYKWRRNTGEHGEHEYRTRLGQINLRGYGRHFHRDSYVDCRLSTLEAYAIDARSAIEQAVALARRGITIYSKPRPLPEMFVPVSPHRSPMSGE